jgi:formylglycine-generating enzyme required for sulfatase activity
MKTKAVLLVLIAGFLAIFACTNPILERIYNLDKETPEPEIIPEIPPVTYTVEMIWIKPGTFLMGSPADDPNHDAIETQHEVTLSGFYIGKYPVTQEQYQAVMGKNPSYFKTPVPPETSTAKRPVEKVTWYEALVFCNKLSMQEGLNPTYRINGSTDPADWGSIPTEWSSPTIDVWDAVQMVAGSDGYRLPTEAQWEYACRAGTTTAYNTGDTISDDTGWYADNSGGRTHEVGLKPPNAFGLYDMHGNVFEWCWDWLESYTSDEQTDPTGPVSGHYRIQRGGSWEDIDFMLRSAFRYDSWFLWDSTIGFRVARNPPAVTHTVTLDLGGGNPVSAQIVVEGKKVIRPPNPEKSGFEFVNWYSDPALTFLYNFDTPVSTDITLYAKWRVITEGMVWIPAGTFMMGSPANEPGRESIETRHQVTLTNGFYMGKYPVTQAQYQAVMGTNPSKFKTPVSPETSTAKRPVEQVKWYDAIVFCNKLSMQEGLSPAYTMYRDDAPYADGAAKTWTNIPANWSTDPADWGTVPDRPIERWFAVRIVEASNGYRLPTEAQWEYACRAGTATAYNTGNTISDDTGWYKSNGENRTHEVGLKPPNAWGLYDMHGNVCEWCWDTSLNNDYAGGPQADPTGAASGSQKILRGGSWYYAEQYLRSASRNSVNVIAQYDDQGFRVVRP